METKFIVVVGGVLSGVGKGVTTASLGKILKEHGYNTTLIKIDPYLNYDAGTLRPTEHGEVWVTHDGGEIDQDLGTYERFMDQDMPKKNNITTGQVYKSVIDRERRGEYLGKTVQIIPHIPEEIIRRIKDASKEYDIAIIEVGGTVGDYENVPYLFALKMLERDLGAHSVAYVLVTYLPVPGHIDEMKTKPTQQAIRLLRKEGIFPNFIICRSKQPIDEPRKKKIEQYVHIDSDHIIAAPDVETIYQIPLDLEQEKLGEKVLQTLHLTSRKKPDWNVWKQSVNAIVKPKNSVNIAVTGKYLDIGNFSLTDSYLSIYQALVHAGAVQDTGINIAWLNTKEFEKDPTQLQKLKQFDGVIVPGGFGNSGVEGKIMVHEFVRKHNIPYLGLCYGMQLAVIEFARNVCGMKDAHTTEVNSATPYPVIDILPYQKNVLKEKQYGGTMRLGAYSAKVKENSKVQDAYKGTQQLDMQNQCVAERHRHRYEVNPEYVKQIEKHGLVFSGYYEREDGTQLMEYIELPNHPFFIATQAHPEFTSRLGNPNPLFKRFVQAICEQQKTIQKNDVVVPQKKEQEVTF